ncbi:MAG: glycosyltransferase family 2 protein [Bacteroidota bacterium]
MVKLSVVIITFNEERNLRRCLEAAMGVADEIVVIDSGSTDDTKAIAKAYNAVVIEHAFEGYAQQKNFASCHAAHDWILSLDADEQLTPELTASILAVKQDPKHVVYEMPRLTNYCGKWIRHCGWYPDRQTRLYNRTKGAWVEKKVHEYWQATDPVETKALLQGDLLHYSFATLDEHRAKIARYTDLAAADAAERGRSAGPLRIWLSPLWHFVSEYLFRLGFLDGAHGFTICRLSAYTAYLKYSKIRLATHK